MVHIDFYILGSNESQTRLACRLADKAWSGQRRVYIHTNTQQDSEQLDQLMWLYQDGSFLPHCIDGADGSAETPILIGHGHEPAQATDVLINLADTVPSFYSRFERIVEPVTGDESIRQKAREHYKYYRDRGYAIATHKLAG